MGQGSSQPMNGGLTELEGRDGGPPLQDFPSPSVFVKKGKSDIQVGGTPAPKRKRRSSLKNTSDGKPSGVPTESQVSPRNQAESRPSKRTKVASSTAGTKEVRKSGKKSTLRATTSLEAEDELSGDMARVNGTSNEPKQPNSKSTQKSEENETPALSQNPIRTASTDQSVTDTSTDQNYSTDATVRGPRKGTKEKLIGFFAPTEVRALESFKLEFCNMHGLSSNAFDQMVQHVDRRKDSGWPCDETITNKTEFWQAIYDVLPGRDRRSVYRFMRRHFQDSSQKPHHWTHEQDEELIAMVGQHGPKFAHIAKLLGRGEDDVVQRWKNRLEHRTTMRRGAWSEEEVRQLLDALQSAWNAFKKDGKDVGQDIYEMDESLVSWGHVSNKLQNCRSRQQCADKWRKIRRKIMGLRSNGMHDAVFDPATEAKPQGRAKSVTLAEQMEMEKVYKSAEYVNSEDGEESEADIPTGAASQSPKTAQKQDTDTEPAGMKATTLPAPGKPAAIPEKAINGTSALHKPESESKSESETNSGSSSESGADSESDSDSDSSSDSDSDTEIDPKTIAQETKGQKKGKKDHEGHSSEAPLKALADAKPSVQNTTNKKRVEGTKVNGKVVKKSVSDPSAKSKTTPRAKAPEKQKTTIQKKEVPQGASSESESDSDFDTDSSSDPSSDPSSESDSDSGSTSEQPPARESLKKGSTNKAPKAPTSAPKASVTKSSKGAQKSNDNGQSSSETSETSSSDNTEDSEESSDDSEGSSAETSDDEPTKSLNTAPSKDSKRKAQAISQPTEKRDIKRLKTNPKSTRDSSFSSEDNESGDDSERDSQESDSEAESDASESTSESSSNSESESESESEPSASSKSKPHTTPPKTQKPKAVNGQKPLRQKPQPSGGIKERNNPKDGRAGLKPVKPGAPAVKKDGSKTKGKSRQTPLKGKTSNSK